MAESETKQPSWWSEHVRKGEEFQRQDGNGRYWVGIYGSTVRGPVQPVPERRDLVKNLQHSVSVEPDRNTIGCLRVGEEHTCRCQAGSLHWHLHGKYERCRVWFHNTVSSAAVPKNDSDPHCRLPIAVHVHSFSYTSQTPRTCSQMQAQNDFISSLEIPMPCRIFHQDLFPIPRRKG